VLDEQVTAMEATEYLDDGIKACTDFFITHCLKSFRILLVCVNSHEILGLRELIHEIHECFIVSLLE